MRNLILTLFAFVLMPFIVVCKNPESSPDYNVKKIAKDSSLGKTESAFEISIYAGGKLIKKENIQLSYNGFQKSIITDIKGIISLKLKPAKYKFQFFYNENHMEITTDSIQSKAGHKTFVNLFFSPSKYREVAEKPVIYIYSEDTTKVSLKLKTGDKLSFTYPEYKDGWNVKSTPSGNLIINDKVFPYLFWEGNINLAQNEINSSEGFIVAKENLVPFFESKLNAMGLNQKEQADFITYWCPRMSQYENCYLRFLFNDSINKYAKLDVSPKPESFFRVFMIWTDASKIDLSTCFEEQEIVSIKRSGLTVIEWGGSEINRDIEKN